MPRIRAFAALLLLPLDVAVALIILIADLILLPLRWLPRRSAPGSVPDLNRVTIQILNWNGRELLKECLPALSAAVQDSGGDHEIVVVDNGSSDDSVTYVRQQFPNVRVVELGRNHFFAGGNNLGVHSCDRDIVVFLNNDMIVAKDFLAPLLQGFHQPGVFAVTAQVVAVDPAQRRQETGRTRARFHHGTLELWHADVNPDDSAPSPVFWAGGGSSAVDRRKFEALGGFDPLYRPLYVEDVDLSIRAWKRGWPSLFAPASCVTHKHRGTSRPVFGDRFVDMTIRKNQFLLVWKNTTSWRRLLPHFLNLPRSHARSVASNGARFEFRAFAGALAALPGALRGRAGVLRWAVLSDDDVFRAACL